LGTPFDLPASVQFDNRQRGVVRRAANAHFQR
jgi:hypothetical protein